MDLIQELNYTCNSLIFRIAYTMRKTLNTREERNRVTLWLKKIMNCNRTVNDLRLRNEFLQNLVTEVENGKLKAPFDMDPPRGSIKPLARQLPGHEENQGQDDEAMAMLRYLPAKYGGFLLPKPLPQVGAYCYVAANSQVECSKKGNFE